jgi:SAM-dependent methyltransferase
MKNIAFAVVGLFAIVTIFSACGSSANSGQLEGVMDRPDWKSINPYGMVYVPSGVLTVGQSDQDIFTSRIQRPRQISIQGFFMDDTEITNNEYRQFVYWVRDSVAHTLLDHFKEDDFGNESLDWEYEIDWADETLEDMNFQGDDVINGKRELDTRQLVFKYQMKDWQKAASPSFRGKRSEILSEQEVAIYPDTLCWIRDFAYSYNEPFARNYFWHPAFDDYPVVGVNWKMAKALVPARSLEYIRATGIPRGAPIVDVGGGASTLVDHLLDLGFSDLTVIDLAPAALAQARARLGDRAQDVHWVEGDITRFRSDRRFALWHDRAVLHFLTGPAEREQYVKVLRRSLSPEGDVILATFGPGGPERCSGLPVVRYDTAALGALLGPGFSCDGATSRSTSRRRGARNSFSTAGGDAVPDRRPPPSAREGS